MEARLQALEGKFSEYGDLRLDLGAIISELASLNSNVRAMTETMVSSLKHSEDKFQWATKVHADRPPAPNTSIGKTFHPPLPPSPTEPEDALCTRFYTRVQADSRGKEVARTPSPPHCENVEAANADDGAGGTSSPGSDCALISPPAKATKPASTPRKRAPANARGKALAKEREVRAGKEGLPGSGTALTAPPAKKVSDNENVLAKIQRATTMRWVAYIPSSNTVFACVQNAHPNAVITACRQVRVPRMSVAGVGAALFSKVRAELHLFLSNWCNEASKVVDITETGIYWELHLTSVGLAVGTCRMRQERGGKAAAEHQQGRQKLCGRWTGTERLCRQRKHPM